MKVAFYGDSLTAGMPGASYFDILRKRLPEATLFNYGQINDTALSLYRRIVKYKLHEPVDAAFLWVGVNDVLIRRSWLFSRLRPSWAKTPALFREHYRALLDILGPRADKVFTVSPLFIGEDMRNPWNQAVGELSAIIRDLSAAYANVEFIDLRAVFIAELETRSTSNYLARNALRSVLDVLTLRSEERIDQKAVERGLHFTLDGVHLNSAGAVLVADTFMKVMGYAKDSKAFCER